jgi:tripeptidyl-peptidase I
MTGMKSFVVLLAAAAAVVNAVAIPPHHEVHEKRQTLHPRWTKRDRVESHKLFQMRIGLKQSNLEKGYQHLLDVYEIPHSNYSVRDIEAKLCLQVRSFFSKLCKTLDFGGSG